MVDAAGVPGDPPDRVGRRPPDPATQPALDDGESRVDKSDVLALLDTEIERAESAASRGGWTGYAILAAMGATAWLLCAELQTGYPDGAVFATAALLASCAADLVLTLRCLAAPRLPMGEPRFLWFGRLLSSRSIVATRGTRDVVLAVVAWTLLPRDAAGLRWLALAYYGGTGVLQLVLAVAVPILAKAPVALPDHARLGLARSIDVLSVAVSACLLSLLAAQMPWGTPAAAFEGLRFGGGAAVLLFLGVGFVQSQPDQCLVAALVEVRRLLALGRIPAHEAARASDMLLRGLRSSDVLQRHVANAQSQIASARAAIRECRHVVQELSRESARASGGESASSVGRLARAKCEDMEDAIGEDLFRARQAIARVEALAAAMAYVSTASRRDTEPLTRQLLDEHAAAWEEHAQLSAELYGAPPDADEPPGTE